MPLRVSLEVSEQVMQSPDVVPEQVEQLESQAANSTRSASALGSKIAGCRLTNTAQTISRNRGSRRTAAYASSIDEVRSSEASRAGELRPSRSRAEIVDGAGGAFGGEGCDIGQSQYRLPRARERSNTPSHSLFELSKTQPAFEATAVVDPFCTTLDESQTPVFELKATHSPLSSAFGLLHDKQPLVPVVQHVSQRGLQSTQAEVVESK